MASLLQIHTSINGTDSLSSSLADQFVTEWRRENTDGHVVVRNLATDPVPHLTAERFGAFTTPVGERSPQQQRIVAQSDLLIDELRFANVIALALPMYNFGVPSTLKAYIDHVARAGETFSYTENGPVGHLNGTRAVVFATRGGQYAGTPLDTQTQYITNFLTFLGIAEPEFVYAEGLAMGEASLKASLSGARDQIADLSLAAA